LRGHTTTTNSNNPKCNTKRRKHKKISYKEGGSMVDNNYGTMTIHWLRNYDGTCVKVEVVAHLVEGRRKMKKVNKRADEE